MTDLHGIPGLTCHAGGQVTLSGPMLELERRLDALFVAWATKLGADEYRFPPLVPARELDRIDYFRSFAHVATFPASLPLAGNHLRTFIGSRGNSGEDAVRLPAVAPLRDVLTPAACYPVYVHFQGRRLDGPIHVTTRATCFRREASYEPLARQHAFSMREIVCLGSRDEVVAFVARCRAEIDRLASALDLRLRWTVATDSFFDASSDASRLAQRLAASKREMTFGDRLALGSVNLHHRRFGKAFRITRGEQPVFSACVAFGLERWLLALVERFGSDTRRWPALEAHHAA